MSRVFFTDGRGTFSESTTPPTPNPDEVTLWFDSDGLLQVVNDAGTIRPGGVVRSGDWTPTLIGSTTAGTQTYTTQIGRYVKVGPLVIAWFQVTLSAKGGTMAGEVLLGGLPFVCRNTTGLAYLGSTVVPVNLATNVVQLTVRAAINSQLAAFRKMTAAAASTTALDVADIGNTTALNSTVVYEAAS